MILVSRDNKHWAEWENSTLEDVCEAIRLRLAQSPARVVWTVMEVQVVRGRYIYTETVVSPIVSGYDSHAPAPSEDVPR